MIDEDIRTKQRSENLHKVIIIKEGVLPSHYICVKHWYFELRLEQMQAILIETAQVWFDIIMNTSQIDISLV